MDTPEDHVRCFALTCCFVHFTFRCYYLLASKFAMVAITRLPKLFRSSHNIHKQHHCRAIPLFADGWHRLYGGGAKYCFVSYP